VSSSVRRIVALEYPFRQLSFGEDLDWAHRDCGTRPIALLHQFHGLRFELIRESSSTSLLHHLELPEWSINPICLTGMAWFYGLQFLFRPWRIAQMVPHLRRAEPTTYLERLLVRWAPGRRREVV